MRWLTGLVAAAMVVGAATVQVTAAAKETARVEAKAWAKVVGLAAAARRTKRSRSSLDWCSAERTASRTSSCNSEGERAAAVAWAAAVVARTKAAASA